MKRTGITKRHILWGLAILLTVGLSIFAWQAYPFVAVGSAYKAKITCSAIFISGRDEESVLNEDVHADTLGKLDSFDVEIDYENKTVTASFHGLFSRTAVFREGIGVTLANDISTADLRAEKRPLPAAEPLSPDILWPEGEGVAPAGIVELDTIVASAFDEPNPDRLLRTRAVVVVHKGRIVAEQYAPGFSSSTPLSGWSMTKSVTNALVGILVGQGKLTRDSDDLLPQWRHSDDSRSTITLDHLLHMSSGLEFREKYKYGNDVTAMLFRQGDASGFAADKPIIHPPGSHYEYNSGTTNIICRIIREKINDDASYHTFPYEKLFRPIGAMSAILERDANGTFVGSSFMYATARDWARIGLLYANDGVWVDDQRILPEGWVDYSRKPATSDSDKKHGAHFWLRLADLADLPDLPGGIFHMSGHEGQFVSIVPEEKLVVVRLGLTLHSGAWKQEEFVAEILGKLGN